jgi:protease-4
MLIRIFTFVGRWLDRIRKTLHLLFMLAALALIYILLSPSTPVVPARGALILDPEGIIVDELSGDPVQRALALAQGMSFGETLLADLVEAVRTGASDERIRALVLDLDGLRGAGLSKLEELADEISRFRATGKPVYAVGNGFTRDQYFLAAAADEILMHPMGLVLIDGYSSYIPYYKSALDKLQVDYNAWTAGEFKSYVEPWTLDGMSDADRLARGAYLGAMWDNYQRDVAAARGLESAALQQYADEFVPLLREMDGDTGRLAVEFGLVDATMPDDLMRQRIRSAVSAGDIAGSSDAFPAIRHRDYLTALRATRASGSESRLIALIVASGTILEGAQPPGSVGAESLSSLIRQAREDQRIRALVLRIDSPGGSAFASEVIRRELEVFRATGKPIVVSMGSVAASGGYWIAMSADEIWASPSTLTGSIGVGATFPTVQRTLERLGVRIDGLGTTALADGMDPFRGISPPMGEYIQMLVDRTYRDFIDMVAEHRELTTDSVLAAADGRVWIGSEAERLGLVDRLGGLDQALESAAELAGLAPGSYGVERLSPELGWAGQLALGLIRITAPVLPALKVESPLPDGLDQLLDAATEPLAFFERLSDPRGIYAYCFCGVE